MSHNPEEWYKIWRKTDLFQNDKKNDPSTQKSEKLALWLVPIVQSI